MLEFFGETDAFDQIFGKAIFFCIPAAQKLDVVSYSGLGQTRVRVSLVDSRHIRVQ